MKSHEGELVREISKLQAMVLELRAGFSRALLELNQIQLGDTELQSQLEETRHGCSKRALHLETLVLSLREELEEVRCQIRQLCGDQIKADQTNSSSAAAASDSAVGCSGVKDTGSSVNGISDANGGEATPLCSEGGALLLHCYLQGLWAGHCSDGDSVSSTASSRQDGLQSCMLQGRRQRAALSLLRSEWDYVSSLGQLYDKYKTPPTTANHSELHKAFARHVDQLLQRHLLFRNSMEERLTVDKRSWAVGDAFLKLTGNNNSAFCDAYLGYVASLATVLSLEFGREQPDKLQKTQEEERDHFTLLSLLLAPVSRIHTYLSTVQFLLSCCGSGHADYRPLQESAQVLRSLCLCCHMTLQRSGQWGEMADPVNSSRCWAVSSNCGRSAFTKYRANPGVGSENHANSRARTADRYAPISVPSNGHERGHCQLAVPKPLLPPNGILRNSRERLCEPQPPGGWSEDCRWDCRGGECCPVPLCMPTARRPQQLLLNPGVAAAAGDIQAAAAHIQKSPSGLVERLCGSPGPDGRVCRSDLYPLPQRIDDGDTDADLGDASVFDYSSVTTCSPDNTLELRGGAGGESREDDEDEDDDEEDSEIPVLLKPTYTPSVTSTTASQREGSVCTRWQIPRTAPIPPEVGGTASGTLRRSKKAPRRIPTGAFRPIWDAPYKQGDATPAKESTVTFSTTNQIINPQRQAEASRSVYRGVHTGSPVGPQRGDGIWNESEDSEGPCSTV